MRTLEFNVKELKLEKVSSCDFSGIVPGSSGYLKARFRFDNTWAGLTKVAVFSERKYESAEIIEKNECVIPDKVLERKTFEIYVVGKDKVTGSKIKTNRIVIEQEG